MLVSDTGRVYYWNKASNATSWQRPDDYLATDAEVFLKEQSEMEAGRLLEKTVEDTTDLFFNNADGMLDSYKTVRIDEDGYPMLDRFVYVDEETCIGCTNCATVARSTFMMTDELGRARVFRQGGDSDDLVQEAVSTCPVDCIWYVSWDDLVILEGERKGKVINNQARLVGGSNIEATGYYGSGGWGVYANQGRPSSESKASIMKGGTRCNNCPGRGCRTCPLYGVGQNPEYARKKAARKTKRKSNAATMIDSLGPGNSLSEDIDLTSIFSGDSYTNSDDPTPTENSLYGKTD
jgi:ferredoxin